MSLTKEVKVRVSAETRSELEENCRAMGEGYKIADVVRLAIGEFLVRRKKKRKAKKSGG